MAQTILVTGAGTGIGAATARELGAQNTVFVHYNASKEPAESVAAGIEKDGGKAHVLQADLTTEEGCRSLVAQVEKLTDHLDVLVNNSGGLVERRPIAEIDWEVMDRVFRLNTFSLIQMTGLCVPLLEKAAAPVIINLSSIVVRHGAAGATLYGASKGAVDVFTRGSAKELAPKIRVNAVAPGVIETPFHDKVSTQEQLENWRNTAPLKRNGTAAHIAHAVRFLIENEFTTGETVDVNGGMFMR